MSKKELKKRLTFLLVPGANQSIRSIRIATYWIILIPILLLLMIVFLFLWQLQTHHNFTKTIAKLHIQISDQQTKYTTMEDEKNETIQRLQSDVAKILKEADILKQQMNEVMELEEQIRNHEALSGKSGQVTISSAQRVTTEQQSQSPSFPLSQPPDSLAWQQWIARQNEALIASQKQASQLTNQLNRMKSQLDEKAQRLHRTPTIWPTQSRSITSTFGYRSNPFYGSTEFHEGIDIDGNLDDAVYATADGTITSTGSDASRGNYILIDHGYGIETQYMHLNDIVVTTGQQVTKGEKIGTIGSTGSSTGTHLHYEVIENGIKVNPYTYLP